MTQKTYEDGLHDGAQILENANAKATPYRIMKAVNSIPFGMQPMFKVCAYFADEDDAEAFLQMMEDREPRAKKNKRYIYRIDVMKPQPEEPGREEDSEVNDGE